MADPIKQLIKSLEAQGWTVVHGSKHWKAIPPDPTAAIVFLPTTPGGGRWFGNLLSQLRRSGYKD